MTQLSSKAPLSKPTHADTAIADNGNIRIRIGAGLRLPPAEIADSARIRVGAGLRLPTA